MGFKYSAVPYLLINLMGFTRPSVQTELDCFYKSNVEFIIAQCFHSVSKEEAFVELNKNFRISASSGANSLQNSVGRRIRLDGLAGYGYSHGWSW